MGQPVPFDNSSVTKWDTNCQMGQLNIYKNTHSSNMWGRKTRYFVYIRVLEYIFFKYRNNFGFK